MCRPRRIVALSLVVVGLSMGAAVLPSPSAGAEPPSVVLVTKDCANANFICPGFRQAAKRTGTRARIISPDPREDIVGTFTLLARQGHDLVIGYPDLAMELDEAARRSPDARFAVFDLPLPLAEGRSANVAAIELRAREAAYLAGWLAARMERLRRGSDA
jgi:basic membrane protein A